MLTALTCPRCGAPLPAPSGSVVSCAYCGASSSVGGGGMFTATPPNQQRAVAAVEAFRAAVAAGLTPFEALQSAAREHLGPFGETDALARVVVNLAQDFDAANGTKVAADPMAMVRLTQAYLTAIEGIRANGSHHVNMPFFTSTKKGPIHFDVTLTPQSIATLAARPPR